VVRGMKAMMATTMETMEMRDNDKSKSEMTVKMKERESKQGERAGSQTLNDSG